MDFLGNILRITTRPAKQDSLSPRSALTRTNSLWTRTTIPSRVNSEPEPPGNGHTIYLIRHGEKPPKLKNGDDAIGLSAKGEKRAQGLVKVFGKTSGYKIECGKRKRAHDTVFPLSSDLGIPIDTSIKRDDIKGIVAAAKAHKGPGNVMICWEHKALGKILEELGVEGTFKYPKSRFDIIWTVRAPYKHLHSWTSEQIEFLDEQQKDPQ